MGDRSENAEYIYGKKRLREIDRRLRWLDKHIEASVVADPAIDRGDRVFFGATVVLGYPDGEEKTFELVGKDELEPHLNRISWVSPIGRAVLRKQEGDLVTFYREGVAVELEILEVIYRPQTPDP